MASTYTLHIVVFRSEPLDYQKFRHTALWLVPEEEDGPQLFCHVTGLTMEFEFEVRRDYDPQSSAKFEKAILVGTTTQALTESEILGELEDTAIMNDDPEFNCQVWVEQALKKLSGAGYITEQEYEDGVNGMIEATLEAADG